MHSYSSLFCILAANKLHNPVINKQQKLFLASLLEENKPEHLHSELSQDRLVKLVEQKLGQGISFHLAAHQAINELAIESQANNQVGSHKKLKYSIFAALILLIFFSAIGYAVYQNNLSNQNPTIFPIAENSINHFSGKISPNTFEGVDISVSESSFVNATGAGEVILVEAHPQIGNSILIRHNENYKTVYGYLSKIDVKEGDIVRKGQKIGESGFTPVKQEAKLHYAIIENEHFIDPILFMRSAISPSL